MGVIGVVAGVILLAVGIALGALAGANRGRSWIREHGCYLCQEKFSDEGTD